MHITQKKNLNSTIFRVAQVWHEVKKKHNIGKTIWVFLATLFFLSLLTAVNLGKPHSFYVAGQVATYNVFADKSLLVEDRQASLARIAQVKAQLPKVFDLSLVDYDNFHDGLLQAFKDSNAIQIDDITALEKFFISIKFPYNEQILECFAKQYVQNVIVHDILPLVHQTMSNGIVKNARSSRLNLGGVIIRNLESNTEVLRQDHTILPDLPSFLIQLSEKIQQNLIFSRAEQQIISNFFTTVLSPTLTYNDEATQLRSERILDAVEPVFYNIKKGETIVRKGEVVSEEQQLKLQSLYGNLSSPFQMHIFIASLFTSLIVSIGLFVSPSGNLGVSLYKRDILLISLLLLVFILGVKSVHTLAVHIDQYLVTLFLFIAFPVAGGAGLVATVFGSRRYCTTGILLSLFTSIIFRTSFSLFLFHFLSSMLVTWIVVSAQNRQDVVWGFVPLYIGQIFIFIGCASLANVPMEMFPILLCVVGVNSILSLMLLFAFSPILEMAFGYSTRFRLMELMSLEHPLLQEMMVNTPGTYHHSLVVANLVEAGANAIGANSLLGKVAALYHDAGKLSRPDYFIENQFGGHNKHDTLPPSMSSLIIISHVKKGIDLANQYKLGQEITDIIAQHHGTRCMRYFYQKAVNLGEKVLEVDYSYPGPRPQSKEAAILMLADSVEASSRTLVDPTPARLQSHIDKIIKGIFSEGQLDESELTFRDLHYLAESFQKILTGIFHQRIVYPSKPAVNGNNKVSPDVAKHFSSNNSTNC